MEDFIAHATYTVCNWGGYLIQISGCGTMARMKDDYGSANPEISDWLEIVEGIIDPDGYNIPLDLCIRI